MDSTEIHPKSSQQIIAELRALQPRVLHLVLLQYCLELTISARMHFVDGRYPVAQDCNETLHSILGFLRSELGDTPRGQVESMVNMIVRNAEQKGGLHLLALALRQARSNQ